MRKIRDSNDRFDNDELAKKFAYCPLTGFIFNRIESRNKKRYSIIGSVTNKGYIQISINGTKILAHRLAMALMGVHVPKGMQIDHINRNGLDNSWSNLRVVTPLENTRNRLIYDEGAIRGVYFDKNRSKNNYTAFLPKSKNGKRRKEYIGIYPCKFQAWMASVMYECGETVNGKTRKQEPILRRMRDVLFAMFKLSV